MAFRCEMQDDYQAAIGFVVLARRWKCDRMLTLAVQQNGISEPAQCPDTSGAFIVHYSRVRFSFRTCTMAKKFTAGYKYLPIGVGEKTKSKYILCATELKPRVT